MIESDNFSLSMNGGLDYGEKAISPESKLAINDPGDDTLRRFRYQITYACILAVVMANDSYKEIYCEHHEDILIKNNNNTFTGIQVKTKDINLPPFNIEDEAIIKSFERFVLLNKTYLNQFETFSILSNHGFDKSKPAVCINLLLEKAKNNEDLLLPRSKSRKLIKEIAITCECTEEFVIETLKKIRLRTFCHLDDIQMKLINQLKDCTLMKGLTESKIKEIADLLITKALKASSLYTEDDNSTHNYIVGITELEDGITEKINQKKITGQYIKDWLTKEKVVPVKILLKDRQIINEVQNSYKKLEIKMDAGGIDSENIETVRDFKFAFEQHSASWIYKDNAQEAEDKYNQVLKVTQNLCKEIYDEDGVGNIDGIGQEMLIRVRKELKSRKHDEPDVFFDCSYEHLLGAVGVLTESCKVWWSPKFKIE